MFYNKSDFIVIGSGLAGLTSALILAEYGTVTLMTKDTLTTSASSLAQGGIASVTDRKDSFSSHIQDTLNAGAQHNNKKAVAFLVEHGPQTIGWLEKQGVLFDKEKNTFALGKEAAHSHRRILHATDFTGKNIVKALLSKVHTLPNIICLEECFLVDLLVRNGRCFGTQVIQDGKVMNFFSRATVLATGGLGQVYQWTTNPKTATGDGIAAGILAGVRMSDLEFIQFHPTALNTHRSPLFLLSEALRGEGAYLVNEKNQRFMQQIDPQAELAPRDIVARAIYQEQKKGNVYLDIRHQGKSFLQKRFPNIYRYLLDLGFDMAKDLLPVTCAVHYSCGGITVDTYGKTNIRNLFAFGEVSHTGVHGANRLASNSLLEATVFPRTLTQSVHTLPKKIVVKDFPLPRYAQYIDFPNIRNNIQKLMWEHVGIVRTRKGLSTALEKIKHWEKTVHDIQEVNADFLETKNMLMTAELITTMALKREKSLGAHYIVS